MSMRGWVRACVCTRRRAVVALDQTGLHARARHVCVIISSNPKVKCEGPYLCTLLSFETPSRPDIISGTDLRVGVCVWPRTRIHSERSLRPGGDRDCITRGRMPDRR
jgi:hypothetical protein